MRGVGEWFVLVMGGTPISVRVRRVTAPKPLISCQQIADQPVCPLMADSRRIWALPVSQQSAVTALSGIDAVGGTG